MVNVLLATIAALVLASSGTASKVPAFVGADFLHPPATTRLIGSTTMVGTYRSASSAAKTIARGFETHYAHTRSMAGIFLEKYTSGGSGLVVESGKVYFEKPGRMRWDYDSPQKKLFLVDGKDVWYYVPADHTASRTSVKQSDDWRTPLALLAGKVKLERLCGSLIVASATAGDGGDAEERPSEPGNSVLVCGPRKEDASAFTRVLIEVNSRSQLVRLSIAEPGDIQMEFRFGDWHENVLIDAGKFRFEPPPGVAIVNDASLAGKVQ